MKNKSKKEQAIVLRKKGYSYKLIAEKLGLSKSTLSCWLCNVPFKPNKLVLQRIKMGPLISGERRRKKRQESTDKIKKSAKKELGKISKRDLWMLGLGLYLGEGAKTYEIVRVINSDPEIIRIAIKWFKDVCGVKNENITAAIHIYPDNDEKEVLKYWQKCIKIPITQFRKTQIDLRKDKSSKKRKKLPYGTAHVTIIGNGNPGFGVNLHRKIVGWMEGICEKI